MPGGEGETFSHGTNCKQYWECLSGTATPKCCPGLERYNTMTGHCEYDRNQVCTIENCDSTVMPGKNDALRRKRVTKTLKYTVNSEIFARVLFSRNFAYAKFRENENLTKCRNQSVVN